MDVRLVVCLADLMAGYLAIQKVAHLEIKMVPQTDKSSVYYLVDRLEYQWARLMAAYSVHNLDCPLEYSMARYSVDSLVHLTVE